MMPAAWDEARLRALPNEKLQTLYRHARNGTDDEAKRLKLLIDELDLYREPDGGLPFDHPIMVEIEDICRDPESVRDALAAAEKGLPPLAGMEHRLVAVLGARYGTHYTTHHAGRCIAEEMINKGWKKVGQRPMPVGMVAKSATVFTRN